MRSAVLLFWDLGGFAHPAANKSACGRAERVAYSRRPYHQRELDKYPARPCLNADPTLLTCIANDGLVQVGMTDLGGNLDILSTFRPSEQLLFDLYDHPDTIKRLTWKAHDLWWRYYERFNALLQPRNPGYTAWAPIFSTVPYYILQCDFCYMISPAMFDEFVKPELAASCRRLSNAFYHLDGPGQLPHLDSLLEIKELKGIQWVPGDGQAGMTHWPEVYRKIRKAGKLIQIWGDLHTLDVFTEQLGTAAGIVMFAHAPAAQEPQVRALLHKYGAG